MKFIIFSYVGLFLGIIWNLRHTKLVVKTFLLIGSNGKKY